jgi:hypothetical protein
MPTSAVSASKASVLAFVAACVLTFALQGHTLWSPLLITDDIAQHHVWLDAGEGSGFQPDDPWNAAAKAIQPYVTAAVFQTLRLLLPTLLVGKVLALVNLAVTSLIVFHIGVRLRGTRLGWIAMGLFFISDAWIGISGGFARSFAWPLVSGFVLSMLYGRQGWTAVCLFLAAALYPVVFVLLAPAYGLLWLYEQVTGGSWRQPGYLPQQWHRYWPVVLAVAAGASLVLLKSRELAHNPWVGPQVTLAEIQTDPIYGVGGRVVVWPQSSLLTLLPWTLMPWDKALLEPVLRHAPRLPGMLPKIVPVVLKAVFTLVPCLAWFLVFRRSQGKAWVLLALALGAAATFLLGELLLPRLYEPSRYLTWSMPVLAVLSWAIVFDAMLGVLRPGRARQALLACLALVLAARAPAIRGKGAEDVSEYTALYTELARTGGEEIIASFPRTSDLIPVLCHRSIYISNEASHGVLFSGYRRLVVDRHAALLKAFYSARQEDVRQFCTAQNISWLVVEEKYYRPAMEPGVLFAPFEQQMRDTLKQTPEPWLLTYARKSGKQVQPGVYLLNTGPIIDSSEQTQP